MKHPRLRLILSTTAFLAFVAIAWWYFAPEQIGGSTRYVVTSGVSMEPRFHTGDLAMVRPAGSYQVGDVVAYWSTLLHTVVLHRIHAIQGNTYLFKGDNNDFIDPIHPTRAELLGKLWLHIPRGGRWLNLIHSPVVAAVICGLLSAGLLLGFGERHRRRKRRRKDAPGGLHKGMPLVKASPDQRVGRRVNLDALLTASAVAAAVFVVLGFIAFTRPAARLTPATTGYTQQVSFAYSASAPPGPVYATGEIHTGDPIFLSLVHRLDVRVKYHFVSGAQHDIAGTEKILLRLTGQSGWSHSLVLTPATRFGGDRTNTVVTLDIPQIQKLLGRVSSLTGILGSSYTISVIPEVRINGAAAGHPLNLSFAPAMNFQFGGVQLLSLGASDTARASMASTSGSSAAGFTATRAGAVGTPGRAPAMLTVLGFSIGVTLLRWISLLGLLLCVVSAAVLYLRRRAEPFQETVHIQSHYGHMIVPIVAGEDLGWPAIDVASIKALVKLAESGQRLILHSRSNDVDSYMVNEEGTVYRYQVKPSKVVWGEWAEPAEPLKQAA